MKKHNLVKCLLAAVLPALGLSPIAVHAVSPVCASPKLSYFGGPILSQVQIVPVFWNSNVNAQVQANLPQFYADVTQSTYWCWLREYSTPTQPLLPGTAVAGITLVPSHCPGSASCSLTDANVESELVRQVGLGVLPAPNANTLYMVHFPPNIVLAGPSGAGTSCANNGFCAYHNTFMSGTNVYVYGCIMDEYSGGCATGCGADANGLQDTTDTASHELVESVTDPYVGLDTANNYAYPCGWADNNNECGEIADICDAGAAGDTITVSGRSWVVQEIWSNVQGKCTSTGPESCAFLFYWDPAATGGSPGSGGSGNWDNGTLDWWVLGVTDTIWPENYVANFAGSNGTVTVASPVTAGGLTFTTPGYTLTGGNPVTLVGATPTITVPTGAATTIGCMLAGTNGLVESGSGTLVLSGVNTYTGSTSVSAGTLALGVGGSIGASPVTVFSRATLSNATAAPGSIGATTTLNSGAMVSFTGLGGVSSAVGKISVTGNLLLNSNAVIVNVTGAALAAGSYRLMDCTGTLSGSVNPIPTLTGLRLSSGYSATISATGGGGGHFDLVVTAAPAFTGLGNPSILYGLGSVTLTGVVSSTGGPATIYPANGDIVGATISGHQVNGTVTNGTGNFSIAYNDPSLTTYPVSGPTYTITYAYAGNVLLHLNAASNTSTALTVTKGEPNVTTWPTASAINYGQTLASSILSGGVATPVGSFAFTAPATAPGAGTAPQNVTFAPTNTPDYNSVTGNVSVTVNSRPVILQGSRPYDGTPSAAAAILTVANKIGTDVVTVASGSGTLASANVGTNELVSVGTLALGGAQVINYTLTGASGSVAVTNPFNPFSIISSTLDVAQTNFVICWQSVPGVVYTVLTNTSLTAPISWTAAGTPITASNTTTCFTLPGGIVGQPNAFVVIKQ